MKFFYLVCSDFAYLFEFSEEPLLPVPKVSEKLRFFKINKLIVLIIYIL